MFRLTAIVLLLLLNTLVAQNNNFALENITTFAGLSASRTKCIIQDSEGYLWIGTMGGGLNRYDGYNFTIFKHHAEDSTSLLHNNVYNLAEDKDGNIWVATNDGLSRFIKGENTFKNYFIRDYFEELSNIGYHSVYEVFVDSKERLWVGASYHGGLLFDKEKETFIPIPQQSNGTVDALPQVYGDFTEDNNGKIWASAGAGLFWYDETQNLFRPAKMESNDWDQFKSKDIFRIYADSKNDIWIMTISDLFKYIPSSQKLVHLLNYTVPSAINSGYEGELTEDLEGNMYAVHINLPHPVKFPNLSEEPVILNSKEIYPTDIYIDSFGITWISDWIQGLHKYVPTKQEFLQIQDNNGQSRWISSRIDAVSLSLKNPELLFIHSREYGTSSLRSYNLNTGRIIDYNIDKAIYGMTPNPDGTFWIGIWNTGLHKWDPRTNELKQFFADTSKTPNLANSSITALRKNDKKNLWIGTFNGLFRVSLDEKDLVHIMPEITPVSMYFDDDILWIGTHGNGLFKYNLISKQSENFQSDKYSNSLSNNIVWDIYRDKDGFLWLATEAGLNRFDLRNNKFEVFKESDGLGNDYIAAILAQDNGSLWLSTNTGISKVYKDTKNRISFSNYDAMDGVNNPNFQNPVKLTDHKGNMYFGGRTGLYYFSPKKGRSIPPVIRIKDLVINGKSQFNSNSGMSDKIRQGELSLKLSYDQNTIAFEFIALHFAKPDKNRYAYYLEGLESDWIYTKKKDVQYINLDPGSYRFHLRAANRDGIWNDEEVIVPVHIKYPWWQTWYAYLMYFGLILGGLAGARSFELNRRKEVENKKLLEAENRRKSQELEEARQLQLSMLPKELPQLPTLDIAVYMQTATEVGGDYYDFHVGMDGTLTVVIGDATGHGMKAGTMVTTTKSLFNSYAPNPDILFSFQEITRCIKQMNLGKLSMCMTMLKIKNNKLQMSTAGMPPSFIFRRDTRVVEEHLFKAMPLGTMDKFPYEIKDTTLNKGDTILLMSDGLPELKNSDGKMYGYKKIRNGFEDIAEKQPEEIISYLKTEGAGWVNNADPDDDVTFVVIKVK